jgi:hypothetical protein
MEGGTFLYRAEAHKGGGKTDDRIVKGRKRNDNGKLMLTKLMLPRHQVTLSQRHLCMSVKQIPEVVFQHSNVVWVWIMVMVDEMPDQG